MLTWLTPTLSVALTVMFVFPVTRAPLAGDVMTTLGAVVSLTTGLFTDNVTDTDPTLPAASEAFTDRVWEPLTTDRVFQAKENGEAGRR